MGDQKNIDRLFQERFKDFEVVPEDRVWENIEATLQEKKRKRRIIPLWLKLGGVAAVLALLFMIGYDFDTKTDFDSNTPITDVKNTSDAASDPSARDSGTGTEASPNNGITIDEEATTNGVASTEEKEKIDEEVPSSKTELATPILEPNNKPVVSQDKNEPSLEAEIDQKIEQRGRAPLQKQQEKDAIVGIDNDTQKRHEKQNTPTNFQNEKKNLTTDKAIAPVTKDALAKNNIPLLYQNQEKREFLSTELPNTQKTIVKTDIVESEKLKDITPEREAEEDITEISKKKSLFDVISEKELETMNSEKEAIAANNNDKKWSVNPVVAPVYYNTIGEGSPIHSQFSDNGKNGDVNLSYGVNVAYNVTDRLSVRSGINKVTVGYTTNDISFAPTVAPTTISTITYDGSLATMAIADRGAAVISSTESFAELGAIDATAFDGAMNQQMGYLEVPLEIKYRVVGNKLGINLIAGASTLFLTDNEITLEADNFSTEMGEANNLNEVSFSTNFGVGVDYSISNQFQLSLEPMFKYQLNSFSDNQGGFKPYILGVYTGFSFKF
ncbi:outer membrane beta-barrel protein [Sungkyunkwania multivorans]|uniref:Outer membrane beta-barrel protein n=1 Tax=Sungkyunkwania multivorans TaxID=1173618 RepID=A0ABW3CZ21_9FLAO